jgi:hypothetical protein
VAREGHLVRGNKMHYDRFDIIEAHLAYCMDFHDGQWGRLYARMSKIHGYFIPGAAWSGYDSLTENGRQIYDNITR